MLQRLKHPGLFLALALMLVLGYGAVTPARAATFTVNTTAWTNDGSCTPANCSLLEAVNAANASAGADTITFNVSGDGNPIFPTSVMVITDTVTIDGTVGTGGFCGPTRIPGVRIGGDLMSSAGDALIQIQAPDTVIRGLVLHQMYRTNQIAVRVDAAGSGSIIECNFMGTNFDGTGSSLSAPQDFVTFGVRSFTSDVLIRYNVIAANQIGIDVSGAGSTGVKIQGNLIGTDITSSLRLPDLGGARVGVLVSGSSNYIGTDADATNDINERNIILGHGLAGIQIGTGADDNTVAGNLIGVNTANAAIANGVGVILGTVSTTATNNRIGGTSAVEQNVISGNVTGIFVQNAGSTGNTILGNIIGLDAFGGSAVANTNEGVRIEQVNGMTIGDSNIISGNGTGIRLANGANNITIANNLIGLNSGGSGAVGNIQGVVIDTGIHTVATNTISGNLIGVVINSDGNTLQGNAIGPTTGGTSGAGNATAVTINSSNNTFTGNNISFNSGVGVSVAAGAGNSLYENDYVANAGLAIDLGANGATANDAGDPDGGVNLLQNFPLVIHGNADAGYIKADLNSVPGGTYTIAFYRTVPPDGGCGGVYLGSTSVPTDGSGNAVDIDFNTALTVGDIVSASATDGANNTSELAACVVAVGEPIFDITPVTLPNAYVGQVYSRTIAVGPAGTATSPYTFSVVSGTLPAWLTLNPTSGVLSGTAPGTTQPASNFTVRITDANRFYDEQAYSIAVTPAPAITFSPTTLPNAGDGLNYAAQTITIAGGASPYTIQIFGLPNSGFSATTVAQTIPGEGSVTVSAAPATGAGTLTFTVEATDQNGVFASQTFTINISSAPTMFWNTTALPNTFVSIPGGYNQTRLAGGSTNTPYTVTVPVPAELASITARGLAFVPQADGFAITGTPTSAGTVSFTAQAQDSVGYTVSQAYTFDVLAAPVQGMNPVAGALPNTIQGLPYSQLFTPTGWTSSTFTFTLSNQNPVGLRGLTPTITTTDVTLSGTTTSSGTVSFDLTVRDTNGFQQTFSYNFTVQAAPVLQVTGTLPPTFIGATYGPIDLVAAPTSGTATSPYTFNVVGLPANGLSFTVNPSVSATTGSITITGTPVAATNVAFSVQATDANGFTSPVTNFTIVVTAAPQVLFSPATLPNTIQNLPAGYQQTITITSGTAPFQACMSAADLASLTAAGLVTVPPISTNCGARTVLAGSTIGVRGAGAGPNFPATGTGTATFVINVQDSTPGPVGPAVADSPTYNITVAAAPVINLAACEPSGFPDTIVALPAGYNSSIGVTSGGTAPYTFIVGGASGAALNSPAGVNGLRGATASPNYTITGPATAAGAVSFDIQAVDAQGFTSVLQSCTINIAATPVITVSSSPVAPLPDRVPGVAYPSVTFAGAGGTGPYTFSVASGALPGGLTLNPTSGVLSGTPTQGNATFSIRAVDANNFTGTGPFDIQIQPITLGATALGPYDNSVPASETINVTGGDGDYTITVASPIAPGTSGLTISTTATGFTLSGTPNVAGTYTFQLNINDGNGGVITPTFTFDIVAPTLEIGVLEAGVFTLETNFFAITNLPMASLTFSGSGGVNPHIVSNITSSIPGVSATLVGTNAAVLSGTPTAAGTYTFTVTIQDGKPVTPNTLTETYTLQVNDTPNITLTANFINGTIGLGYGAYFVGAGGVAPYDFCLLSGTLPAGVVGTNLPSCATGTFGTGSLSGIPTTVQNLTIRVVARDSLGTTGAANFNIQIFPVTVDITTLTLPDGTVGAAYNQTIAATGGTTPYNFTVTGGALPAGVTLNPTSGVISGVPTTAGPIGVVITVTDAGGLTDSVTYAFDIDDVTQLTIAPNSLPTGIQNQAYTSTTLSASGGTAPYSFAVSSGSLPSGLNLSSAGTISGTPTVTGNFTFTVQALDSSIPQRAGVRSYTITIASANSAGFDSNPAPSATINFGVVPAGGSVTQNIIVSEVGGSALNVSMATFGGAHPGDFSITVNNPPFTINDGGASVTLVVRCIPSSSLDARTATLNLTTNDPLKPSVSYTLKCNDSTPPTNVTQDPNQAPVPSNSIAPGVVVETTLYPSGEAPGTGSSVIANVTGGPTGLSLRSGPYLGASMLGILRRNKDYPVLAQNAGDGQGKFNWYLLVDADNDRVGWASGRYLTLKGNVASVPVQTTIFDTIDNSPDLKATLYVRGNVNIRLRPSLRMPVLTVTPYGAELIALGKTVQGGMIQWVHIKWTDEDNRTWIGWVYFRFDSPILLQARGADLRVLPTR